MAESLAKAKVHAKVHAKGKSKQKDVANLEQFMLDKVTDAPTPSEQPLELAQKKAPGGGPPIVSAI